MSSSSSSFSPPLSSPPSPPPHVEETVDRAVRFLTSTEATLHPEAARQFLHNTLKLGNEEIELAYDRIRKNASEDNNKNDNDKLSTENLSGHHPHPHRILPVDTPSSSSPLNRNSTAAGITGMYTAIRPSVSTDNNPEKNTESNPVLSSIPLSSSLSTVVPSTSSLPSSLPFSSTISPTSTVVPFVHSSSTLVESTANRRMKMLSNILQYAALGATAGYFWKVYDLTNHIQNFMDVSSPSLQQQQPSSSTQPMTNNGGTGLSGIPSINSNSIPNYPYPQASPYSSSYTAPPSGTGNFMYPHPSPYHHHPYNVQNNSTTTAQPYPTPPPPSSSASASISGTYSMVPYDPNLTSPSPRIPSYTTNVSGHPSLTAPNPMSSSNSNNGSSTTTTDLLDEQRNQFQKTIENIKDMEQQTKHSVQTLQLLVENMNQTVSSTLTTMNKHIHEANAAVMETKTLNSYMNQTVQHIQQEVHALVEQSTSIRSPQGINTSTISNYATPNKDTKDTITNSNIIVSTPSTATTTTIPVIASSTELLPPSNSNSIPILSPINPNTSTTFTTPLSGGEKLSTVSSSSSLSSSSSTTTTEISSTLLSSSVVPPLLPPSPTKDTILSNVSNALVSIVSQNDTTTLINGINTLIMAVRNMIENPHATRYRRIPMVNDHFRKKLGIIKDHESLFKALGFLPVDDVWKWQPWLLSTDTLVNKDKDSTTNLLAMEFEAFLLPSIDILKEIVPLLQQKCKELTERKETTTEAIITNDIETKQVTVTSSSSTVNVFTPPPPLPTEGATNTNTTNGNQSTSVFITPPVTTNSNSDTSSSSTAPNRIPRPSIGSTTASVLSISSVRSSVNTVPTNLSSFSSVINATNAPPEILARALARSRSGSLSAGIGPGGNNLGGSRLSRSRAGSRVSLSSLPTGITNNNNNDQDTLGLQNIDLFLNDLASSAVSNVPPRTTTTGIVEPVSPPGLSMDTLLRNSNINNPLPSSPVTSLPSVVTSPASSIRKSLLPNEGGYGGNTSTNNNRLSMSSDTVSRMNNSNEVLLLDSSHLVPSPIKLITDSLPTTKESTVDTIPSLVPSSTPSTGETVPVVEIMNSEENEERNSPPPLSYTDLIKYIETNRIEDLPGIQQFEEKLSILASNPSVHQPRTLAPPKPWEKSVGKNDNETLSIIDNDNNYLPFDTNIPIRTITPSQQSGNNSSETFNRRTSSSSSSSSPVKSSNDLLFSNNNDSVTTMDEGTVEGRRSNNLPVPNNPSSPSLPAENTTQSSLSLSTQSIIDNNNDYYRVSSPGGNSKLSSPTTTTNMNIELRESKTNSAGREPRPSITNNTVVPRSSTVPMTAAPPAYRVGRYDT